MAAERSASTSSTLSTLQIDQDRPVGRALSPAPIIDADHPDRQTMANGSPPLQRAKQGVVALGQTKPLRQPLCRPSSGGMRQQNGQVTDALRPSGEGPRHPGHRVDEGHPLAIGIATSPTGLPEAHLHRRAVGWKVLQPAGIPAMTTPRWRAANRTAPWPNGQGMNNPARLDPLHVQDLNIWPRGPFCFLLHPASKPGPRQHQPISAHPLVRLSHQRKSRQTHQGCG